MHKSLKINVPSCSFWHQAQTFFQKLAHEKCIIEAMTEKKAAKANTTPNRISNAAKAFVVHIQSGSLRSRFCNDYRRVSKIEIAQNDMQKSA